MQTMRKLTTLLTLLSLSATAALAGTVSLTPVRDATLIASDEGAVADALGPHLRAGRTNQSSDSDRRALLSFDVSAAVPHGATVVEATLILFKSGGTAAASEVTLHRLLQDWGTGSSSFAGGQGDDVTLGDVTWIHRFYNAAAPDDSPSWIDPGGDFEPSASASATVGATGYYQWSAPQMAADVQSWLDGSASNPGWLLLGDESSGGSVRRFDSVDNPDESRRPLLIVEYELGGDDELDDEDEDED
jgi:hypothetical protein